jgi:outer membrane protein assembly factor BamB
MTKQKTPKRRFTTNDLIAYAASTVAVVAGLFALVVCVLLIANYLQVSAVNPLDNPQLVELRKQLAAAPETDEKMVQTIRGMDLLARKAFFTSQEELRTGGYLLLGSVALLLIALKIAAVARPKLPEPSEPEGPDSYWKMLKRSREWLSFAGALLVIAAMLCAYLAQSALPISALGPAALETKKPEIKRVAERTFPTWDEMKQQWPTFRGPGAYGVAVFTDVPTEWDLAAGKGIKWKMQVTLPGHNSPVVWGKRIFLSGADENVREVYCFNADSGELLWKKPLPKFPTTPAEPTKVGEGTGFAPSTMAVQGDRICAIFPNGDLACFDPEGNLVWGRNIGKPDNHYGHASSLLAYQGLLFVQYDQKTNPKLYALDLDTGKEVWTAARGKMSWSSPLCVPASMGQELVLSSSKDVIAYDPLSGKQLWMQSCLDGEVAPSAAYANDMVFVANEYATGTAIRLSKDGEAVKSEIAWQWDEALPDVSSPVGSDKFFFVATSRGELVCLDREKGEKRWLHEFEEGFLSSPVVVGDKLFVADRKGTVYCVKAGETFEQVAASKMDEEIQATPAFLDKRIYIRTATSLVCVEKAQ